MSDTKKCPMCKGRGQATERGSKLGDMVSCPMCGGDGEVDAVAKLQKYTVVMPIERASGVRSYVVDATSAEAAKRIVDTGDVECEHEELEVEKVAPIEEWTVYDADGRPCK